MPHTVSRWLICWGACGVWLGWSAAASGQLITPNAGVAVDAQGVLRTVATGDDGELARRRVEEARARLGPRVSRRSELRKVSLTRLEKALAAELAGGGKPSDEMRYLAGLTRLQYVFCYPASGDVVIAGPAEGWATDAAGRVVGIETGSPVLELQDLVVGLRAFGAGEPATAVIGCSIDATPEGLARMQQFLRSIGTRADPRDAAHTQRIVDGLRTSLGMHKVRIDGVPPDTHFAQVLVEADYRMKLIGIGLETPPVAIDSYVDRADPATVSRNALQRWWFVPNYRCARVGAEGLSLELVGRGVQLKNEQELVGLDGSRQSTGVASRASEAFVAGFTQQYEELSRKHPVYAQLRNLIDIAVAAAFIQQQDHYGKTGWTAETLGDEQKLPVRTYPVPLEVETAVAASWKGNRLMTPVGGGVVIHPLEALRPSNRVPDMLGQPSLVRQRVSVDHLEPGQWWWD